MDLYLLEPFGLWFISATLLGLFSIDCAINDWARLASFTIPLFFLVKGVILIFSSHPGLTAVVRLLAVIGGVAFYALVLIVAFKMFTKLYSVIERKMAGCR